MSESHNVRESLEKEPVKQPAAGGISCYDLARDIAGSVKGLPEDLADNPDYLEDFGR